MKKIFLLLILLSNFAIGQNVDAEQINDLVNTIAKLIHKSKDSNSASSYAKEILNITDVVNSASNARFHGGKSRIGFKLNLPTGTQKWFYRITIMNVETNFNYQPSESFYNSLTKHTSLTPRKLTEDGLDVYITDDYNINNFLETGNDNFKSYEDYKTLNTSSFINTSDLIKNNLWIGIKNPNMMQGLKVIVEVVAMGNFN